MSLFSAHDDDTIFAGVTAVLTRRAPTLTSADVAQLALQTILSDAHRAVATFAEKWNQDYGRNLPSELLSMCFEYLAFDERLFVSAVSRRWRAVALASPRLWSTFEVDVANNQDGKLAEMLERSGNAALSVSLYLDEDEELLLRPHVRRLATLSCKRPPSQRLLPLDAPRLETLEISSPSKRPVCLSDELLGRSPCLRTIRVHSFTISPTCPSMANLRSFSGTFENAATFPTLLAHCPQLHSITAECLFDGATLDLLFTPLPSSLEFVSLLGLRIRTAHPVYAALSPWLGHQFRVLRFERTFYTAGLMQLFAESHGGAWGMSVSRNGLNLYVLSHRDVSGEEHRTEIVGCHDLDASSALASFVSTMSGAAPFLANMTALSIPASFLRVLLIATLTLPTLATFTLETDRPRDQRPYTAYQDSSPNRFLCMPQLRTFTFAARPGAELQQDALDWFFGTLPGLFRRWFRYDAATLERIQLEPGDERMPRAWPQWYTHADANSVYALAREVYITPEAFDDA